MEKILTALAALIVAVQLSLLGTVSPAGAISADLAKKCRDMAIKAHPMELPGAKPYAQAERDYFKTCVSNNGKMQDSGPPNPETPQNPSPPSPPKASPSPN
jgi:hypothetical protein